MKYPKIETLFNRDENFKVVEGDYRLPEFENIKQWIITEKVDGTNVRIIYQPVYETTGFISLSSIQEYRGMELIFKGRTDKAQLHPNLTAHLEKTFTVEKMESTFTVTDEEAQEGRRVDVVLFGEGYGPKIQKGGNYREDISFRLFDVYIKDMENPLGGWWLEPAKIQEIADNLGVKTVPYLGTYTVKQIIDHVKALFPSQIAATEGGNPEYLMEGVVARTKPLLFTRRGHKMMFKLKVKDFPRLSTGSPSSGGTET